MMHNDDNMLPEDAIIISEHSLDAIHFSLITLQSTLRRAYNQDDIDLMREMIFNAYRDAEGAIQHCHQIVYYIQDEEE